MTTKLPSGLLAADVPVAHAVVAALADAGIEFVVGIPGGLTGPLWKALCEHPSIRSVLVRQEAIGSYMAEAAGRLRGKPLVVMGQGEWIAGNAGQGYLESLLGSSPMVVLTEMSDGGMLSHHGPYQCGSGDFGVWDTRKALEGVTKRVLVARHPAQGVQLVQQAVKHSIAGDPGPVAVIFAATALQGTVAAEGVPRVFRSSAYLNVAPPHADDAQVSAVCTLLEEAQRPVIIAGNGVRVSQACAELLAAARALDAAVVTTAHGKGVIDERDPLAGGVMGAFGWPSANDLVAEADVVLAIGTKLGTMDTIDGNSRLLDPSRQHVIHVDVEPLMVGWTTPASTPVVSDAAAFLRAVRGATTGTLPARARPAAARVAELRHPSDDPAFTDDALPFAPQRIIAALNRCVPDDAIVTCDAGENRLFMMRWYESKRPGGYLQPAAGGGMGHAIPAALGAKLVHPECPVVAVCGDGGFAMAMHGLMTALEEDLPISVVVLNNQALGWVKHGMGAKAVASEFRDFDHAAIARAMGCDGVRPTSAAELDAAIERVGCQARTVVIDVPTGLDTSFRDILDPIDRRRIDTGY
jgi:acetolactate synthase-1/2/3 large subunit